ncbi:hypothetical protein ACFL7D_08800 [candidate division KSB1 bacterium]
MPEDNITVLILNGVKKVRSIKVNRKRIRYAIYTVSLFTILFSSSIALNIYLFNNSGRSIRMPDLSSDNTANNNQRQEPQIGQETEKPENSGQINNEIQGTNNQGHTSPNDVTTPVDITENDKTSDIISIQELSPTLSYNGRRLTVTLRIRKDDTMRNYVAGRILIVAKTTSSVRPFAAPVGIELNQDGTARNFRSGLDFEMSAITPVKSGEILLTENSAEFEYFRIYVYSNSGELLIQKTERLR